MNIAILRLGHRLVRDYGPTTHVALVARAFGCSKLYMTDIDDSIKSTLVDVNNRWGYNEFNFEIELVTNWKNILKRWKEKGGTVLHLTMYGINIDDVIPAIKKNTDQFLIVIGAEKVPSEVYRISDYNIAIGNQPHSEIAALAITLDRIFEGKQLKFDFESAKMKIIPSSTGKSIEKI